MKKRAARPFHRVEEGEWILLAVFEGPAPCGRPEWAWSGFGYHLGVLKFSTIGRTLPEAIDQARRLAGLPPVSEKPKRDETCSSTN